MNLINKAIEKRGGKPSLEDKVEKVRDSDTNSQVSAITFMYTNSTLNSKKKAKDGIQ